MIEMNEKVKEAIETYQCSGCSAGCDVECGRFEKGYSLSCFHHFPGTIIFPSVGKIFLGMPHGFNRTGSGIGTPNLKIDIFKTLEGKNKDFAYYDKFNVPCWKYKNEKGHTMVRGLSPRANEPFLHIILEDCIKDIDCLEITDEDINGMD